MPASKVSAFFNIANFQYRVRTGRVIDDRVIPKRTRNSTASRYGIGDHGVEGAWRNHLAQLDLCQCTYNYNV